MKNRRKTLENNQLDRNSNLTELDEKAKLLLKEAEENAKKI